MDNTYSRYNSTNKRTHNKQPSIKTIKVGVFIGNLPNATLLPDKIHYQGLYYDIWKHFRIDLEKKYHITEHFINVESIQYDSIINQVYQGTYDLFIGSFIVTSIRNKLVLYTLPITMDHNTLLYYPKINVFKTIYHIFTKIILKPLLYIIIAGTIIGIVLFYISPPDINNDVSLIHSIINSLSSLLRIPGFIKNYSAVTNTSAIFVIFISILAFLFVVAIQSFVTDEIIQLYSKLDLIYTPSNIKGKHVLCPKNSPSCTNLYTFGVNITRPAYYLDDTIQYYRKNSDKYDAVALKFYDGLYYSKKYEDLQVGRSNLGYIPYYWIINPKRQDILLEINKNIFTFKNNQQMDKICKGYLQLSDIHLCSVT